MKRVSLAEPGWGGPFLALLSGALLPLAFAPVSLYLLGLFLPALLFLLWEKSSSPLVALRHGWLFGIGMFGSGVSWVYVAIHDYGFTSAPVAALFTFLFVLIMAAYPALVGYLVLRSRQSLNLPAPLFLAVWLPGLWVAGEWVRGWLLSGFPWLSLGYSQIDAPLSGWATVLGVYGVSLALAVSAGMLVLVVSQRRLVMLFPFLLIWLGGWLLTQQQWTVAAGDPIRVTLVQGNLPQITKWDPAGIERRLTTYEALTLEVLDQSDMVVWPENAITVFYDDYRESYFDTLAERVRLSGSDLVLGVPLMAEDGAGYFTTLMNIGDSGRQFYKKSHLVPFGEYVPLEGLLRGLIRFFDLPMSGFSPGPADQPPLEVAGNKAAMTICYEDAFASEALRNLPQATLLINGSNNAWYGNSLAPHQHLQIARMRSLESGRPMVRATTNGISALIDPQGKLMAISPQFQTYVLQGTVQPMGGSTPYVRWGNWSVIGLIIILMGGVWLTTRHPKEMQR
jgi:apolipoprotein N-acyltransferase